MWFRVDDKLPNHAKTRRVRKSHPSKRRDAAPFGLWVLAGAFSDDGFIPLEVLEDWDDDAEALADRLVLAGLWIECEQAGEPGYRFHDWAAHNPVDAATSGIYGNHKRWHVGGKKPSDDCPLCISEGLVAQNPVEKAEQQELSGRVAPESPPIIAPDSGGCIAPESLPDPIRPDPIRPDPTRTEPNRTDPSLVAKKVRPDVESLLDHLDGCIRANGAKVPSRTQANIDAARLLIDRDGRDVGEIHTVIDWATSDEFWRTNILSMSKLRAQYDQLNLKRTTQPRQRHDPREAMFADWEAKYGPPPFATNAIEGAVV